jgi:uncharacterized protein YbcI
MRESVLDATERPRELHGALSQRIVQVYKEHYGRGPANARVHMTGDVVVCVLDGVLTNADRTLRDAGERRLLAEHRDAFRRAAGGRLVAAVEALTGRSVVSFMSGVDLDAESSSEVFVLQPSVIAPAP